MSNDIKIIGFGCDYVRWRLHDFSSLPPFFGDLFSLDWDNSPTLLFGDYIVTRSSKDRWIVSIDGFRFPVLTFWRSKQGGVMRHHLDFYSAFFHFPRCFELYKNLYSLCRGVTRLDIAVDLDCSIGAAKDLVVTDLPEVNYYWETYYFGRFSNKRRRIRLYDKLADSAKKGKLELFSYNEAFVTRLELELRQRGCKERLVDIMTPFDHEKLWVILMKECTGQFSMPSLFSERLPFTLEWWKRDRGLPDPVLRFREACMRARAKGVDIRSVVDGLDPHVV